MNNVKEECSCPPGQHKNAAGECVPDQETSMTDNSMEMLEFKHQLEKSDLKHARDFKTVNEALTKSKAELTQKIMEVDGNQKQCCNRLGETQKLLLETEAIAKGSLDKINGLEPKFEQFVETWQTKLTSEASTLVSMANDIKTDVGKLKTVTDGLQEVLAQKVSKEQLDCAVAELPKLAESLKNVQESLGRLPGIEEAVKPLQEKLAALPDVEEVLKPIRETLANIPNMAEVVKPLQESINKIECSIVESDKKYGTLNTVYEALNKKYEGFVKETEAKKLHETQDSTAKLEEMKKEIEQKDQTLKEMQDQINTLKLHVKPGFKAKLEEKKVEPSFSPPYTYSK